MSNSNLESTRPDPLDPAGCACANLRKASRAVTQVYDADLRPTGLKATQFTVLATLATVGDIPLTRLADAMVMDRTTLTRNLKPLVARGLVRVAPDGDRRIRRINLTRSGAVAFDQALPYWRKAQARLVDGLGRTRWRGLLDATAGAVSAVRED